MRFFSRQMLMMLICGALLVTTACNNGNNNAAGPNGGTNGLNGQTGADHSGQMNRLNVNNGTSANLLNQNENAVVPLVKGRQGQYVSAERLAQVLEYTSEWDQTTQSFRIGDTDIVYELKINSRQALKEGNAIELSSAPVLINGITHIPVGAIPDLFQEDMDYEITGRSLIIHPAAGFDGLENADDDPADEELDFAEDPEDPFKDEEAQSIDDGTMDADEAVWSGRMIENSTLHNSATPALKNINMSTLIRTAIRYKGVRYKFGAAPYPQSRRFDCSSYTKYVFGKYGVELSRTARYQATQGKYVSRKSLRRGDLLFFYVPGRFKSNKVVGHEGIYIGNGKMIHSAPKPDNGVQISSINHHYWKKTFLKARRVAY
jgi:cell wall-associated NlpC family hydrolase